ncbi:MAG: hypothetical protein WD448_10495 [Woeseia sp.]
MLAVKAPVIMMQHYDVANLAPQLPLPRPNVHIGSGYHAARKLEKIR